MSLKVVIDRKALLYLSELPDKSQRLIKEKCHALAENPFPGQGGDKELLHLGPLLPTSLLGTELGFKLDQSRHRYCYAALGALQASF